MKKICLLITLVVGFGNFSKADESIAEKSRIKKIYGHYMGCFPAARGAISHYRKTQNPKISHLSTNSELKLAGRFRAWPLVPPTLNLSAVDDAELEIRRAIRAGLDGFAIDAWAGGDEAKATLDALFAAAERGNYPFEVTICLDPSCLPKGLDGYASAINYILEKHGNSPHLARRDGKPLIFGYASQGILQGEDRKPAEDEESWALQGQAYRELEKKIGQPLYFMYDMSSFFHLADFSKLPGSRPPHQPGIWSVKAAAALAKDFDAVGLFMDSNCGPELEEMGKAVVAAGSEWSPPIWVQYDNFKGAMHAPEGTALLRDSWERARKHGATILQFVTWNDYGEHTSLAPTTATGYGFGILNRYLTDWWKTGTAPAPDQDRILVTYRKYPSSAKTFPFRSSRSAPDVLEVLTLLTSEATVSVPGRGENGAAFEYQAPAGLFIQTLPLTPGPVEASVARDGKVVAKVKGNEPITDKPYRMDNTLQCASSDDEKYWNEDFPNLPYPQVSEYGDDDGDGLPNWFEAHWFGKWTHESQTTLADPQEDSNSDGRTNKQNHDEQTDPINKPATYPIGAKWEFTDVLQSKATFNPDEDSQGTPVWFYLYKFGKPPIARDGQYLPTRTSYYLSHAAPSREPGFENLGGEISLRAPTPDRPVPVLQVRARNQCLMAVAWQSPVNGIVDVSWKVAPVRTSNGLTMEVQHSNPLQSLWSRVFSKDDTSEETLSSIQVRKGDKIYFVADSQPDHDGGESLLFEQISIKLQGLTE